MVRYVAASLVILATLNFADPVSCAERGATSAPSGATVPIVEDVSAKQAFDDAKELGTAEAWKAFLANYPAGFYTDLARAYLQKLDVDDPTPVSPPEQNATAGAGPQLATSRELRVSTAEQLSAALESASAGDEIVLEPGTYAGQLYRENLRQVTIRSAARESPAVIRGGDFGLQLSDPVDVTLADLVFQDQEENGVNIDDGGSYETPARNIRLMRIAVKNILKPGNHDGIKMAGVEGFLIDGVRVENWGSEGSAIDFVGCRDGIVQNSLLIHSFLDVGGSGIRPKGGSKDIVIRANRIQLPVASGRAIQAGGSTDAEFFRFAAGERNYEADNITIEGNVVVGGGSAFSWVNIDGGLVHHNLVQGPAPWVMRILNENPGTEIVVTKNGEFADNEIAFETGGDFNAAVNVGDDTEAESFRFARNRWLNLADATAEGSRPKLPVEESDGVYGEQLTNSPDRIQVWQFPWGKWLVNATPDAATIDVPDSAKFKIVSSRKDATFSPSSERPLAGSWSAKDLDEGSLAMSAMSQAILINLDTCQGCLN